MMKDTVVAPICMMCTKRQQFSHLNLGDGGVSASHLVGGPWCSHHDSNPSAAVNRSVVRGCCAYWMPHVFSLCVRNSHIRDLTFIVSTRTIEAYQPPKVVEDPDLRPVLHVQGHCVCLRRWACTFNWPCSKDRYARCYCMSHVV
jgi:hypothetical protein